MKIAESVAAEYKINTIYDIPTYAERLKIDNFLKVVKSKTVLLKVTKYYKWWDSTTFMDHYSRHGFDFWNISEVEYARLANNFFMNSSNFLRKTDSQWTIRLYDPKTNSFGSFNSNGTTKTFYKPNPTVHGYVSNLEYWNAQPWK